MANKVFHAYPIDGNYFAPRMVLYGFKQPESFPPKMDYNYVNEFSKIAKIAENDLTPLVRGVAYWYDGRDVRRTYNTTRNKMYPQFECEVCDFKLSFGLWNPDSGKSQKEAWEVEPRYFRFLRDSSQPYHAHDCDRDQVTGLPDHNKKVLMDKCPFMFDLVRDGKKRVSVYPTRYSDVIKDLHTIYGKDFKDFGRSMHTGVIQTLERKLYMEHSDSYSLIPVLFDELAKKNKYITLILQVESNFRFYRMFCGVPNAKNLFYKLCIPIIYVDGCFSKYRLWDGVLIIFSARTGNGSMIILGVVWCPCEDAGHTTWSLECLEDAGINIDKVLFICDRGNLTSACIAYSKLKDRCIHLFYCLEHIIRNCNVRMKFKRDSTQYRQLRKIIGNIQRSQDFRVFKMWVLELEQAFGDQGKLLAVYLLEGIHPQHWTFFANRESIPTNSWMDEYYDLICHLKEIPRPEDPTILIRDPLPVGDKHCVYGNARNNMAESSAKLAGEKGMRSVPPIFGAEILLNIHRDQVGTYKKELQMMVESNSQFTTIGERLFNISKQRENGVSINEQAMSQEEDNLTIFNFSMSDQHYNQVHCWVEIDSDERYTQQCNCTFFERYNHMCPHIIKALPLSMTMESGDNSYNLYAPFWSVPQDALEVLDNNHHTVVFGFSELRGVYLADVSIDPPQFCRVKKNYKNRIRSAGEVGPGRIAPRTRISQRLTWTSEPISRQKPTADTLAITRALKEKGHYEFMIQDHQNINSAAQPIDTDDVNMLVDQLRNRKAKKEYTCSECGVPGHNVQRCQKFFEKEVGYCSNKELIPGPYICYYLPEDLVEPQPELRVPTPPNHADAVVDGSIPIQSFAYITIQLLNAENESTEVPPDIVEEDESNVIPSGSLDWFFEDEETDGSPKMVLETDGGP